MLDNARKLLKSQEGKTLSVQERCDKAVELAALIVASAQDIQTFSERLHNAQLKKMMQDPKGQAFVTAFTDQCFRSQKPWRVVNQLQYLLDYFGVPQFLSPIKRLGFFIFQHCGSFAPAVFTPLLRSILRWEISHVILPGEAKKLTRHIQKRQSQNLKVNLNHLGEAILGEEEALARLQCYLDDLASPFVTYISIKITTICSQINLLAPEHTLYVLSERFRTLLRAAAANPISDKDGTLRPKFVNLDMEEFRDLKLTVTLFESVLSEDEFLQQSAGIVLQAYLPDSFSIQQKLTKWALERVQKGGAAIKIRIVKGANLAMEKVDAAINNWPAAPFSHKADVDANYKLMLGYACIKEHAKAVHIGVASHNLFDIAYALILRAENTVFPYICFEMLEGMADPIRRCVHSLCNDMLVYCPAAKKEEFQSAVAYLIRRLDENTTPGNFLRDAFAIRPGNSVWKDQVASFRQSCVDINTVKTSSFRVQDRNKAPIDPKPDAAFKNEPDTDWSLPHNVEWIHTAYRKWKNKTFPKPIPLCVNGSFITEGADLSLGNDPSNPSKPFYSHVLANKAMLDTALDCAKKAAAAWAKTPLSEKKALLFAIAKTLRARRADFICAMLCDGGKIIAEADAEVSEAIDFCEYYAKSVDTLYAHVELDIKPRGVCLITPPWNFPCAIPMGGIAAALITGNAVLFKPAPETLLIASLLATAIWDSGCSLELLQYIACSDNPEGDFLLKDPRIDLCILTGATSTAKHFLAARPSLTLNAETGGKNAIIVTSMADRDLSIANIVKSAFGHSGQKCSAASLLILEADVYDDPSFFTILRDCAKSLHVGSAWDLSTRVPPLIRSPGKDLLYALTTQEEGEQWLLKPEQDKTNPNLWSPGIKIGVKKGSQSHLTEFFGPVLSVMRATDLEDAISLANATPYGLTSGLFSLDCREQNQWKNAIHAGNCYINRSITGACVLRQPFGGHKQSCYGFGLKAGGPNYLWQFVCVTQNTPPLKKGHLLPPLQALSCLLQNVLGKSFEIWESAAHSYSLAMQECFSKEQDLVTLLGQDNILRYLPREKVALRFEEGDSLLSLCLIVAAAAASACPLEISCGASLPQPLRRFSEKYPELLELVEEEKEDFLARIPALPRVRSLKTADDTLMRAVAQSGGFYYNSPPCLTGAYELLYYLKEQSISTDYHRYGNLGERAQKVS